VKTYLVEFGENIKDVYDLWKKWMGNLNIFLSCKKLKW